MQPFPEDLVGFIDQNVEMIDQLEILRILGEDRDREWDSAVLAGEVQARPQVVVAHLKAMHARGLLRIRAAQGGGLSCRFGPGTPELEDLVGRLLQVYKERPVTTIRIVYQHAKDPLRAFADVIRIKKLK